MLFVNEVADIIHTQVDQYSGAPNKNIGEAFLIVWKFPNVDVETDAHDQLYLRKSNWVNAMADMSVLSYIKCIAVIRKSHEMIKYS